MSALGDISAALGPAAQGIGQGLAGGAQLQAQDQQQQQRINTDAAAQRAQAQYQQQQIALAQKENDRRDYGSQLDLLANPKTVGDLSATPAGKARLMQARDAVNGYAQKYGWASLPPDVDVTHPVAGPQAAATAVVTNALQPDTAPTSPSSGSGADLSLPSMANPWDRNHAATVLAVHEGLDKAHLVNVGRSMQAELEGHLGNPQAATWLGPTYDQALTLRNKLATMLNNPKTSAADLRALIGQHPQAAEDHSQAVGGRPFAQTTALQMPDLNVLLGRTSPGDAAPQSAMLPAGVAGPQPPPGSIRTAGGTQIPATLAPGVAGPQPPPGAYRDATGTVMPPAAAPSSPAASSVLGPILAGMGLSPSPSASAAPTAAAPPPTAPAAPTVAGMPGSALGSMTPAGQALFSFDYGAEVKRLQGLYPNMTPEQIQGLAQGTLGALQTQAQGQENSALFPLKIIAASLEQGKTIAQTKEQLALAGFHLQQGDIERARLQIEQQNANTARMNAQTEQTKAGAEASRFGQQFGLQQQEFANKQDQDFFTNATKADQILNQEKRIEIQGARAQIAPLLKIAHDAMPRTVDFANGGFQGGVYYGPVHAGVNLNKGETVFQGISYGNNPQLKAAIDHLTNLVTQPGVIPANTVLEAHALHDPLSGMDKRLVPALGAIKSGLKSGYTDPNNPQGAKLGFAQYFNYLATANPASAILALRVWKAANPGKPNPAGLDVSPLVNMIGGGPGTIAAAPAAMWTPPAGLGPSGPNAPQPTRLAPGVYNESGQLVPYSQQAPPGSINSPFYGDGPTQ